MRFLAYGAETCPNTGKKHHQAYAYFYNRRSASKKVLCQIGAMFGDIHCNVLPMYGSILQNETYCSKDTKGLLTKFGDEPAQGMRGDLKETTALILKGELDCDTIAEESPVFFHQYGRTMERCQTIAMRRVWRTEMTKGIWFTGPSGSGKSHHAFEGFDPSTHYVKNLNDEWWDGYRGQPIVILNELKFQIPMKELLDLVDKYPKTVKQRNREPVPFLAKEVRVASIHHPEDLYGGNGEPMAQFHRRFKIVILDERCPVGNNETTGPV